MFTYGCKKITGVHVVVHNKERLLQFQPCVYLGNHQSNFDVFIQSCSYTKNTVAIGKKELIYIPIFGLLFYLCGHILLDRHDRSHAVKSFDKVKDYILSKKVSVYIFPEGTRNHGAEKLLPFKKGAFYLAIGAQVPIVPIVASPIYTLINPRTKTIKKGTINIEVLEPIYTKGKTEDDVDALLKEVQEKMQGAFESSRSEIG
ncbi:MAG: 1-acyl-sn-glycerol-3-phosphate acyltransferase [Oligoflexia bacterium]|nr:1-acyl-sn-glycerol-3-phosphate acyltransferase [Oligoflexia bacterium]